jgi:hypothetical protein
VRWFFKKISEKQKLQVVLPRSVYNIPIRFFQNSVPLKSSGTVESANLFEHILNSLCVFREYAISVLSKSENLPKVFNLIFKLRQKSLSVHRHCGKF